MNDQTKEQLTRNIVKLILYSNAVLLNSWLLFVLWRDPMKRFRNLTSFIIANLALVDILGAIGGLGSTITIFTCRSCVDDHKLFAFIQTDGLQCSFIFITLLAFDRFLAISYPYKYNMSCDNKRCYVSICILGWLIGSILSYLVHYLDLNKEKGQQFVLHYLYVVDVAFLALVTAIIYPLNYYNYVRNKRIFRESINRNQALDDRQLAQQLNVSSMIAATVLFTLMAPYSITLSYFLRNCFTCLYDKTFKKFWVNYQVAMAVIFFINPIIYAWRLPLYRKSSVVVAKKICNIFPRREEPNKAGDTMLKITMKRDNEEKIMTQLTTSTTGINDV